MTLYFYALIQTPPVKWPCMFMDLFKYRLLNDPVFLCRYAAETHERFLLLVQYYIVHFTKVLEIKP